MRSLYDLTDDELVQEISTTVKGSQDYIDQFREEAVESYNYVDGYQWDEEDTEKLTEEQRAFVVFNRLAVNIDVVVGLGITNPQDILPYPVDIGDVVIDEILEGAIRYIRKDCNASEEEAAVADDLYTTGLGVGNVFVDYSNTTPKLQVVRVNPLEMAWDKNAERQNLLDAEWVARERTYSLNTIDFLWPGVSDKLELKAVNTPVRSYIGSGFGIGKKITNFPSTDYGNRNSMEGSGNIFNREGVPVLEFQWYEYADVWELTNLSSGQTFVITKDRYDKIKEQYQLDSYPKVKLKKRVQYKCFIIGDMIVEKTVNASDRFFTYIFATGKRDRKNGQWYGLTRVMRDPQKWANKFFATILDIISKNAKGGAFVEKDALDNPVEAEQQWSKSSPFIKLKKGGISRIRERTNVDYPAGLERLMQFSIESIRDMTGLNVELLGLADRRQAGVLETSRKQSALVILARFESSMKLFRKSEGLLIIEFMRKYYTPTQLIKIDSQNVNRFDTLQAIFYNEEMDYEVLVDEAPSSPNVKDKVWFSLVQVLPIMLRMGVPIPPEIFDYAPFPVALTQKWKAMLGGVLAGTTQQTDGRDVNNLITSEQNTSPENPVEQQQYIQGLG